MAQRSEGLRAAKGLSMGLDLGDRISEVCLKDREGEVLERAKVKTKDTAMAAYFGGRARCRVVLEVGTHSPWVQRLLAGLGHEAVVANPHQVRLIAESVEKGDSSDAEILADLGRMGFGALRTVEHRSAEAQADMEVLRARALLVRQRAALATHIRGVVKANGARVSGCGVRASSEKVLEQVPLALRPTIAPLQQQVEALSGSIRAYDRRVAELIEERYPVATLLQRVRGVGPITALTYVLVIGRPERFRRSRQVGAYVGLVPRRRQSGDRDPELGVTKAGDGEMRRLLVQCAHHILSHESADSALRRWGLKKAEGGKTAYKRAVVAVARKLAVLLHVLWLRGEVYEAFPNSRDEQGEPAEQAQKEVAVSTTTVA
ncbi:MAG: IS110 family transposase [Chloroflexi bacterium]|nr:IS110 family transposase [Chloroflexota bacterium]